MTQLIFNKKIANDILNDNMLRDELIVTLNELIDAEFLKNDDEIDFELIDTYTDALNELYMGKGVPAVFWKLQTVEEFINSITTNKKAKRIARAFRTVAIACAVFAILVASNKVTQEVTGQGIVRHVAEAVEEILTGEVFRNISPTTTNAEENNPDSLSKDGITEEITDEQTTGEQEITDLPSSQITPQLPLLPQIGITQTETTTGIQILPTLPDWSQILTPSQQESTTNSKVESTTKPKQETTTQKQETTTKKPTTQVTPQNPSLPGVLFPTFPPKPETTTKPQDETFTRVDEDVTSAPIVVKLTGEFDRNFKRDYVVGEKADFSGLTVKAKYDNGTTKTIPISQCKVSGFSTSSPKNCIVKVEYEGCSFSFLIRVSSEATTKPTTTEPTTQEPTTTQKPTTTKPHNPDLPTVLTPTDKPTQTTTTKPQDEAFTRVDEDVTSAPTVIKLAGVYGENFKQDYVVGEKADFSGLTVKAKYDNGDSKEIPLSKCNISGFSTATAGNRVVTVEYEGCTFSFMIRVKEAN